MPCAVTSTDVPNLPESRTLIAIAGTSAMNGAASSVLRLIVWIDDAQPGIGAHETEAAADRARIFTARASAAGRGSVMRRSTTTTAKKLTVLMPSAHEIPPRLIVTPASSGPMTRPRFHCAEPSAIAPGRSSMGTRSGIIAW